MKSRTKSCAQERDVKSDLNTIINEVRQEFRKQLVKRKELITRLGNAFESVGSNPESICKRIKNSLHQEIADKIITARDIERYCLDKWKKKTKPKNDNLSFTKQEKPQQQIAVSQDGKSVIMNDTSTNKELYPISDSVNESHDQSKQNRIGTNAKNEEKIADADTKEEPVVTHPPNVEIVPVNKQNEDLTDREKEMFVSHVPMSFEDLQKDMDAIIQITKEVNSIFFRVSVDLGTREVEIEFCGITEQKESTMISTGKGILKARSVILKIIFLMQE
jgi:hypothetical protein